MISSPKNWENIFKGQNKVKFFKIHGKMENLYQSRILGALLLFLIETKIKEKPQVQESFNSTLWLDKYNFYKITCQIQFLLTWLKLCFWKKI